MQMVVVFSGVVSDSGMVIVQSRMESVFLCLCFSMVVSEGCVVLLWCSVCFNSRKEIEYISSIMLQQVMGVFC